MQKLLLVCLLFSCAVNAEQQTATGESHYNPVNVVRQIELPVESSAQTVNGQPSKKTFQGQGMQGWLDNTGAWHIRGEVHHSRLRCGNYETGIQLGRGNPVCADVEWLTNVEYVTSLRHCNSATRLHTGGGEFSAAANPLDEVTCVRVVVRCEGTC